MRTSPSALRPTAPRRKPSPHVTDGYLDFVEDKAEWTGTDITFDIAPAADGAEVRFTHVGLVPAQECFDRCFPAWDFYIGTSLRNRISTGRGEPNEKETD